MVPVGEVAVTVGPIGEVAVTVGPVREVALAGKAAVAFEVPAVLEEAVLEVTAVLADVGDGEVVGLHATNCKLNRKKVTETRQPMYLIFAMNCPFMKAIVGLIYDQDTSVPYVSLSTNDFFIEPLGILDMSLTSLILSERTSARVQKTRSQPWFNIITQFATLALFYHSLPRLYADLGGTKP